MTIASTYGRSVAAVEADVAEFGDDGETFAVFQSLLPQPATRMAAARAPTMRCMPTATARASEELRRELVF
jgi:hypothetical protein